MNLDELRRSLGTGSDAEALGTVQELEPTCESVEQAKAFLWAIVSQLLRTNRLVAAATLLWGRELFDARPKTVRRIFNAIESEAKLILLGCGSAGKSYCTAVWFLLDFLKDPLFTNSKVISTSAGHNKSNVFSTLNMLHQSSVISLPGVLLDGFIGVNPRNRHASISRVSIPQGSTGRAALAGFHPIPRSTADPVYGTVGRVRAFIDEAEEVSGGLWGGINNMLLSMEGSNLIKVVCACNPRNILSALANQAQPVQGWTRVVPDKDHDWISKERWRVVRIDAPFHLENVSEQRMVYRGFMSFEGYENLRLQAGGNSPEYWTLGRGLYPLEGVANVVIPISFLDEVFGTLVFAGRAVPVGALDVAFEGQDQAIFAAGRYGLCSGWRPQNSKEVVPFSEARYCFQLDQFYEMAKVRTLEMARNTMELCESLGIGPDWCLIDRTGNGTGVHDSMMSLWSPLTHGVNWGQDATEYRILEDDSHKAIEEFADLPTEMYMTLRKWIEFGYFKISPNARADKLIQEMTQRQYQLVGKGPTGLGRVKIQSKREFKNVYKWSPDHADAMVMALHQARINGPEKSRMTARRPRKVLQTMGIVERTQWVDFNRQLDS